MIVLNGSDDDLSSVFSAFGVKLESFGVTLESIDRHMSHSTQFLESIKNSNNMLLDIIEAEARNAGLSSVSDSNQRGGDGGSGDGGTDSEKAKAKSSFFSKIMGGLFGGLASLAGTLFGPIITTLSGAFSAISAPLVSIGRLFLRAGPIGAVIFGMYEVFKDIGENPIFTETMALIKTTFNDRIVPTFNRIVETIGSLIEPSTQLGDWFNNFRIQIQDFVLETLGNLTTTLAGVLDGIDLLLNGEWLVGLKTVASSLFTGIYNLFNSALTNILQVFGVDFGEEGTLFGTIGASITALSTSIGEKWLQFKTFIVDSWNGVLDFFVGENGYVMTTLTSASTAISEKWNSFVNVLTVDLPNKIGEWRDAAFESLNGMREVVTGFVGDIMDKFIFIKDVVVSFFQLKFEEVVSGLESAFASLATRILNIPDQLYLAISENLRFGLPTISVPLPDWLGGGDVTLLQGFDVGVGNSATQAAAAARIDARNTELTAKLDSINAEIESRRQKLNDLLDAGTSTERGVTVVQVPVPTPIVGGPTTIVTNNNSNNYASDPTRSLDPALIGYR